MLHTKEYDKFNFLNGNRGIMPQHVNNLVDALQEDDFLEYHPLLVDKDYNILDGQHRLLAAKRLGLSVYYHVIKDPEVAKKLLVATNSNKRNWILEDYLNYYVSLGFPEYIKLRNLLDDLNISFTHLTYVFLTNISKKKPADEFRSGAYIHKDMEYTKEVFENIKDITNILIAHTTVPPICWNTKKMYKTLKFIISNDNYNKEHFINNIKTLSFKVCPKNTLQENLRFFVSIHNYRLKKRIELDDSQQGEEE